MSRIVKYPTDTWREDRSRSMQRICSTGAMPISTAHDDAATARTARAMALLQRGALAVRIVLVRCLARGASTTVMMLPRGPEHQTAAHQHPGDANYAAAGRARWPG